MKQTAVEWLVKKYFEDYNVLISELEFQQSKELEKQQIVNAYINGKYESDLVVMSDKYYAEQYYNETFNNYKE